MTRLSVLFVLGAVACAAKGVDVERDGAIGHPVSADVSETDGALHADTLKLARSEKGDGDEIPVEDLPNFVIKWVNAKSELQYGSTKNETRDSTENDTQELENPFVFLPSFSTAVLRNANRRIHL